MKRIIIHWTGGSHTPSAEDLSHYHFVIDGKGTVLKGKFAPEANLGRLTQGAYAAHTLNCNTGSIGVALAAMGRAVEVPFDTGPWPVTAAQLASLATLCADLARQYDIRIGPKTVLTHAEVQPNLGIVQRGKWDVTWIPPYARPIGPRAMGDVLRERIQAKSADEPADENVTLVKSSKGGGKFGHVNWQAIGAVLASVLAWLGQAIWKALKTVLKKRR